ncbi:Tellurite resistance protein-related protein [Nitrococcus mobilis Nb-231]|uniref:Tellurite resistance protein-related protein n=1 Tax=Nitrococcus mobilis Nb-231 TaxID=314278 RepID=A4BVK9_9GAMM|nr:class I SAM-dependent methyltransferase [Nitrococcus mobilis]EAR20274.1 Tellurite resistance protein-related protein [Nitrococcus mobilis Nb-231]
MAQPQHDKQRRASATLSYYDRHAERFFDQTVDIDMSAARHRFLAYLPADAAILDAGCGSGRDAAAFVRAGYQVSAFDGSPRLAAVAAQRLGLNVAVKRFEDLTLEPRLDGIWACASLLHLPMRRLSDAFVRLGNGLRPHGVLYASFKHGSGERNAGGRHFTDLDENGLAELLKEMAILRALEVWVAPDQRPERNSEYWLNALLRRSR